MGYGFVEGHEIGGERRGDLLGLFSTRLRIPIQEPAKDGHLGSHLCNCVGQLLVLNLDLSKSAGEKGILPSDQLLLLLQALDLFSLSFARRLSGGTVS